MTSQESAVLESLVTPLDPSDYGKMPASYYNSSQKVKELVPEAHSPENVDIPSGTSPNKSNPKEVRFIRPLLFPRDKFDGVEDSDDESETGAEEDEEEKPTLVGEFEIDMNDEQEEFIEFSREALGITPDLWGSIIKERQDRGGESRENSFRSGTWLKYRFSFCSHFNENEERIWKTKGNFIAITFEEGRARFTKGQFQIKFFRSCYGCVGC